MNKKILGGIIGAVVLIAIIFGLLKSKGVDTTSGVRSIIKPSIKIESPAKYLPDNTIMLYTLSDLKGIWKDVSSSKFWNEFSNLRVWTDFGIKENLAKVIGELEKRVGMKVTESRFLDLFGNSITFAVIMDKEGEKIRVIVQSFIGKTSQFVESSLKNMMPATSITYNGIDIKTVMPKTEGTPKIAYAIVNNILTFAFGDAESDLKAIVDIIKGNKKSALVNDENYQAIQKLLDGDENCNSFYYVDFTKISTQLQDLLKPLIEAQPEKFQGVDIDEVAKNLKQIKFVGGKAVRTSSGVNVISKIVPDLNAMTPEQKQSWSQKKELKTALEFAPKDALLVNASAGLNLKQLWSTVNSSAKGNPQATTINPVGNILLALKQFETSYDINIGDDIINKIGSEMMFVFSGVNLKGTFPTPSISFLLQANDSSGLKKSIVSILKKLLTGDNAALPITLADAKENGMDLTILKTPLGDNLSPVLAEKDGWIFISTNKDSLTKILKVKSGSVEKLIKSSNFKAGVPVANISSQCSFADLKGLNIQLKEVIDWVLQRKDIIPQAEQYKDIATNIATYLVPALDSLQVFKSLGFSSYTKGEISTSEINLILKDK